MKSLRVALLVLTLSIATDAAAPSPLVDYYSSDRCALAFNPIHDAPTALLLEPSLRADLLGRWRSLSPQSDAAVRLKGLLLEDAGDPACVDLLQKNEGDRIRLLWKAGREEQARLIWQNLEGSRFQQAAAALLPIVATGNEKEVSRFRDFLLEPLPPDEVVPLCLATGLPAGMAEDVEIQREWNRRNPLIDSIARDRFPDALRLAMTLEGKSLSIGEFGEIRQFLRSPERSRQERIQVLEGLDRAMEGHWNNSEPVTITLLSDWMEAHPREVADVLCGLVRRGVHRVAWHSGLPGIVSLRRELEQSPENRAAALCLALALKGAGGRVDQIAAVWQVAADPHMAAPPVPGRRSLYGGLSADTLEHLALQFAANCLPETYAEDWMSEWLSAESRSPSDTVRMSARLGLVGHFWEAWQETTKNPASLRMLLECAAYSRIPRARYDQRKAIDTAFVGVAGESWSRDLRGSLDVGTVVPVGRDTGGTTIIGGGSGLSSEDFASLNVFRYLLANALAVGNPLRQVRPLDGLRLEENVGVALHGFFVSHPDNQGNGYFTPMIGNPEFPIKMSAAQNPDPALMDGLLAQMDRSRLSLKSTRSLEVMKLASCSPMDERAIAALREELEKWWDQDRDPDVGKMLISFRRSKDRAQWPAWEALWKEVSAAIPPHGRAAYSKSLASRLLPEERAGFFSVAGLMTEKDEWMYPSMANGELFPHLEMGKTEAFLGCNFVENLWVRGQGEGMLEKLMVAKEEGFEAAKALGASDSDLALSEIYTTSAGYHLGFVKSLLQNPRATAALARRCYAELRDKKDLEGTRLCLDIICGSDPASASPLLDDPWILEAFGAAALESWTDRVVGLRGQPGEDLVGHLVSIATRLEKAGNIDGAIGIAMKGPLFSPEGLALFPPGQKRLEFLAAWLTSKPEELRQSRRTTNLTERDWRTFPKLSVEDWRALLKLLLAEERWEIRTSARGCDMPLLYALLSAGVKDAADALEQGQMNPDAFASLLGRAAVVQAFGSEDCSRRIRMLALDLASLTERDKSSGEVLRMLLKYPEEDSEISETFRRCAKVFSGSPSDEVLERMLKLGEIDAASEIAKHVGEGQDAARVVISRSRIFAQLGHRREAWTLVDSQWAAVKEMGARQPAYLRNLLPLAREAGEVQAVRDLIALAPDLKAPQVVESLNWLKERESD